MKQTVMMKQLKVRSIKGWSLQLAKYMGIDNLVVKGDSLTCIQSYCDTSACPSWRAQFIIEDFGVVNDSSKVRPKPNFEEF